LSEAEDDVRALKNYSVFLVLVEGHDKFGLRAVAIGGRGSHQAFCLLLQELYLEVWRVGPREVGITLAEGFRVCGRQDRVPLNYSLMFALQLRKSAKPSGIPNTDRL
jgi:hypothetical protein